MKRVFRRIKEHGQEIVETNITGGFILNEPLLNKGTAFTDEERADFSMHGHLPYHVSTLDEQVQRRYANFKEKKGDLEKFTFLAALQNRNEVLFYKLVLDHIEEMLPYIYTPTVGDASINYSYIYNQVRGIYLSYPQKGKLKEVLQSVHRDRVDVIVITDGSRILGLGDLGVGGMVIPVGKLSLYTVFGGIHPARTLPIVLDVGTDNQELLNDPLYIGWRNERIDGDDYYEFVEEAVYAIKDRFPGVLLQWEDFQKIHARTLLHTYQSEICSFNDDIQGTASVTLSALYAGVAANHSTIERETYIIVGGGSAGTGIARMIKEALLLEGVPYEDALSHIFVFDVMGLLHEGLPDLDDAQKEFAQKEAFLQKHGLPERVSIDDAIDCIKPIAMVGVSGQSGIITKEHVMRMSQYHKRPVILPLSNPKSRVEISPLDAIVASNGSAIIAAGSPFENVFFNGITHEISQCNNVYIFPGVGLGLIAANAQTVSDDVFIIAAKKLSSLSPLLSKTGERIFPHLSTLRSVSREIAITIVEHLQKTGKSKKDTRSATERVDEAIWTPKYPIFRKLNDEKMP